MNKDYIYIDGTLIVEDENFKKRIVDYTDNFEEVLKQENLIETMENKKGDLNDKLNKCLEKKKESKIDIKFSFALYILFNVMIYFVYVKMFGINPILINTPRFGVIDYKIIYNTFLTSIATLIFGYTSIKGFLKYKKSIKIEHAINSELEFLEKEIEIEKEKLEELNDKKNVVWPTTGIKISEVDDKELLENLKKQLELHYNIGYNSQKYFKYLENGILEEKLKDKNYTEEEIECISKYLEEKGPILSRKK